MKIIFAQGNPGKDYEKTRHNVGFLAADYYAGKHNMTFQPKAKFSSDIAESTVAGEKLLLVKPATYYNDTGKAARALLDFYKAQSTDVLVIHDELALPFGTLRLREKGSDAGNNGIKSLNAHLGENYFRLRVGTANEIAEKVTPFDFVLSKFTAEEGDKLQSDIFPKISEIIDDFVNDDHQLTSHSV